MDLKKDLEKIKKVALKAIEQAVDLDSIEGIKQQYFGRKEGEINSILKSLKELSVEVKREVGAFANDVKVELQNALQEKHEAIEKKEIDAQLAAEWIDVTSDLGASEKRYEGSLHPHTKTRHELEQLFTSLGFMVYDGPELGSDYYCFETLNIPSDHPARDMTDTLYIKDHPNWLMRAHTSECQARIMQEFGAPVRAVYFGRCFRNEATDARHEHTFYQFEGLMVDKEINYSHLKYIIEKVAKGLFGSYVETRFNPKFYPFVEPGFSGDVTCILCEGKGCSVCKHSGWLEFFGAGVVHPNVLRAGNIDPDQFQGIAFGFGSSRMTQLKYGIDDARLAQSGDLRFLKQF